MADYYRDTYVPRSRQRAPDRIVPKLEEVYGEIEKILLESKVESDITAFSDDTRAGAEVVILSPP